MATPIQRSVKPSTAVGRTMTKAALAVERGIEDGVQASSMMAKTVMLSEGKRHRIASPPRKRWGVRWHWYTKNRTFEKNSVVFYWGAPPYWEEYGTRRVVLGARSHTGPYTIKGRNTKGGRVKLPDGGVRRAVQHPGRRARPFWRGVRDKVERASKPVFRHRLAASFTKGIR